MTFKASRKLLASGIAALALTVSAGLFAPASVSARNGHSVNPPVVASQCDHPGFAHFGFASKAACLSRVATSTPGQGGYGGNGGNNHPSINITLQNVVNSAVTITVNFVTNLFS